MIFYMLLKQNRLITKISKKVNILLPHRNYNYIESSVVFQSEFTHQFYWSKVISFKKHTVLCMPTFHLIRYLYFAGESIICNRQ